MSDSNRHSDCPPAAELEAYFDGAVEDDGRRERITTHVSSCERCRAVLHNLHGLREGLRSVDKPSAPPYVHKIARRSMRVSGRTRHWSRIVMGSLAACAVLAAALAVTAYWYGPPANESAMWALAYVEDHRKYEGTSSHIKQAAQGTVALEQRLAEQLPFEPKLPAWREAAIVSGRPCSIEGAKVALVQYRHAGEIMSLYVWPGAGNLAGNAERRSQVGDHQVFAWHADGFQYVLVAPSSLHDFCNQLAMAGEMSP